MKINRITISVMLLLGLNLSILQTAYSQQSETIHKAIVDGDVNKVKELIEADSTLMESKDKNGNTPLNLACLHGFTREPDIAEFLISKGANINTENNNGFTPLHGASSFAGDAGGANYDLVQLLVTNGANVNAKDKRGNTPLHASIGSVNIARFLIEHGADVNAKADIGTALHRSLTYDSNDEMPQLLIKNGVKLNQKDKLGNTELHLAAMNGFANLISLMVKNGSDVNAVNHNNRTALYYAAKHGYSHAAEALINAGADKSSIVETNYGKAPQLTEKLEEGEAYLWFMKLGGYVIKTKSHLLILTYINIDTSFEAGLSNGQINPNELTDQNVIVLAHYPRADFSKTDEGKFAKLIPDSKWVFYSGEPKKVNRDIQNLPTYQLIGPDDHSSFNKIKVYTTPAKGRGGVGFLFEVDGLKIFDCISYASSNKAKELEKYRNGIDAMKLYGPIDIAILRVHSDMGNTYEPYLYLIDQLSPKAIYLTEGFANPDEYLRCADFLSVRKVEVEHPETNMVAGDRFHYIME